MLEFRQESIDVILGYLELESKELITYTTLLPTIAKI